MPFRGGHGRTPGATDPRQGKARGETYMKQRASGLIVVPFILLFVVAVYVAGIFLFDPGLQHWGLGGLALMVIGAAAWRWQKRARATSIRDTLTNLRED